MRPGLTICVGNLEIENLEISNLEIAVSRMVEASRWLCRISARAGVGVCDPRSEIGLARVGQDFS